MSKTSNIQKELIGIGKDIAEQLKQLKETKAIAFYGAIASGFADKYSDIDMVCIVDKLPSTEKRKNTLENLGKITITLSQNFSRGRGQDVFKFKNKNIGIAYLTKNYINERIKVIKLRGNIARDDEAFIAEVYKTKEIWNKKLFQNYKRIIKKYIKLKSTAKFLWRVLHGFIKHEGGIKEALMRKNYIWVNKIIDLNVGYFLFCLYAINNKYYYERDMKWSFKKIPTFKYKPKNCVKKLEQISLLGNKSKDLKKKIRILKNLIKHLKPLMKKYED